MVPFSRAVRCAALGLVVIISACGTRADRSAIQAAERAGLASVAASREATEATFAAPAGAAAGAPSDGGAPPVEASDHRARAAGSRGAIGTSSRPTSTAAGATTAAEPTRSMPTNAASGKAGRRSDASPRATDAKTAAPAPGTAGASGKGQIAIGSVGTLSGPVGAFVKDSVFAVGVWAKWVNRRGGVNGHPVRHIIADDGGDPARYNTLVRQMAEEQGVIAFLFNSIGFAGGDLSYINQKRIPIIGHEGGSERAYESPMVFTPWPAGATYAYGLLASLSQVAIGEGKRKLASFACSDVKLCDVFDKMWTGPAAKELGFEVVYRARPSLTQPDFTAECIAARQAGAQAIIMGLDNNSVLRVGRSCARQNFKPVYGMADGLALPSIATDPAMDGTVVGTKVAPWPSRDNPGLAEMHDAFAAIAPGVDVNGSTPPAWVSAKLFEAAARNLPDNPTSADVLAGLWAVSGETVGGLTYPLAFKKDEPSPRQACWGVVRVAGGKFTAPKGSAVTCK